MITDCYCTDGHTVFYGCPVRWLLLPWGVFPMSPHGFDHMALPRAIQHAVLRRKGTLPGEIASKEMPWLDSRAGSPPAPTTASSSPSPSPALAGGTKSGGASLTSPTSSLSSPSPGLSKGAAVGIGVGVGLSVIGLVALLAALYLIRSKRAKTAGGDGFAPSKPDDSDVGTPQELDSAAMYQIDSEARYLELAATHPPQELA